MICLGILNFVSIFDDTLGIIHISMISTIIIVADHDNTFNDRVKQGTLLLVELWFDVD